MSVETDILSESTWDGYFMDMATFVSTKSKDRSMRCGTVIIGEGNCVLSTGYNGFPRGVDDYNEEYHKRPEKYAWTEHGERNAIYNAARNGVRLLGSKAYITGYPCVECARAIVQAGIVEIIVPTKETDPFFLMGRWDDWEESFAKARKILKAGNVRVGEYGV